MEKVIDLKEELKKCYVEKNKGNDFYHQYSANDMVLFAEIIAKQTVDLCAYNLVKGKNCELVDGKLVIYNDLSKVLNTKNQIK